MFKLKQPCPKCPFRSDIEPYLTYERADEISAFLLADQTFPCHETIDYDEDTDDEEPYYAVWGDDWQYCAGALIILMRMERPNQMMRIGMRFNGDGKGFDPDLLDMDAPVYEDLDDWVTAHDC